MIEKFFQVPIISFQTCQTTPQANQLPRMHRYSHLLPILPNIHNVNVPKTKTDCTPISLMAILLRAIVFKTHPGQSIREKAPLLTSATAATEATHPDGCYSTPLPNVHLCSNQSVFQTTPPCHIGFFWSHILNLLAGDKLGKVPPHQSNKKGITITPLSFFVCPQKPYITSLHIVGTHL